MDSARRERLKSLSNPICIGVGECSRVVRNLVAPPFWVVLTNEGPSLSSICLVSLSGVPNLRFHIWAHLVHGPTMPPLKDTRYCGIRRVVPTAGFCKGPACWIQTRWTFHNRCL